MFFTVTFDMYVLDGNAKTLEEVSLNLFKKRLQEEKWIGLLPVNGPKIAK